MRLQVRNINIILYTLHNLYTHLYTTCYRCIHVIRFGFYTEILNFNPLNKGTCTRFRVQHEFLREPNTDIVSSFNYKKKKNKYIQFDHVHLPYVP